jgi:hypothetical protein
VQTFKVMTELEKQEQTPIEQDVKNTSSAQQEEQEQPTTESQASDSEAAVVETEQTETEGIEVAASTQATSEEDDDHDHAEVESDEEEHDDLAHEHDEMPDYAHMDNQTLLKEAEKLLRDEAIQRIKSRMEAIKTALYKSLEDVRQEKLHEFLEDGGNALDFEYVQPERQKFRDLYNDFKSKRRAYAKGLEDQLNQNLLVKQNLIERLKDLAGREESIGDSFKEFREIQEKWHATGAVPRAVSQDLWNTFKHFEEAFYDFIRISKELRDLDFKKNLEAKEALCQQAEELLNAEVNQESFLKLQNLHKKWKTIGPLDSAHREPIWQRFAEASRAVHEKRKVYFDGLQQQKEERLAQKEALIIELESVDISQAQSHKNWQNLTKKVSELIDAYKKLGRVNDPKNDVLWDRFREASRNFSRKRNSFYREQKKIQQQNMEQKRALLKRAEELKDSEDWKETAAELKRIQQEWKKVGFVNRQDSEKIWRDFNATCNYFFNRLSERNKKQDAERMGALDEKKALIEKLQSISNDSPSEALEEIRNLIATWKAVGPVPKSARQVEHDFSNALDKKFKDLKVSKQEARMIRFENKLNEIIERGDTSVLTKEIQMVSQKIDDLTKELRQLENNINFFSNTNSKNPLVKEVHRNIDRLKDEIELLKSQRKILSETRRNTEQQ